MSRLVSRVFLLFTFLVSAAPLVVTTQVAAQDETFIPVIMVVDLQQVLENSMAAADLQTQLNVVNDKNQAEVTPQSESVAAARTRFNEARGKVSAQELEAQRAELQRMVAAYQQEVSTRKTQLKARMDRSMDEIQRKLQEVIIQLAGERGANLVLAKGAVIIMTGNYDATSDALERLNQVMPTVQLAN